MSRRPEDVKQKRIWITWEIQRRNRSMSRVLGAKLFELINDRTRLIRYGLLILRTLGLIRKERPDIVFAQNPSIVLSLLIVISKRLFSYKAVVDEHNSGLFPLEGKSSFLKYVAQFIIRNADLVIVTNQALAEHCQNFGGQAVIYPDPLPELDPLEQREPADSTHRPTIFIFVCTWANDEPYEEVLEASRSLDPVHFRILITGRYQGKVDKNSVPDSVRLTGFISENEYIETFRNADGAIILTTRKNCMNCGAYEAVALTVPGILSDHHVLRDYFGDSFLYTANDSDSIEKALIEFSGYQEELKQRISDKKLDVLQEEREKTKALESAIRAAGNGAKKASWSQAE